MERNNIGRFLTAEYHPVFRERMILCIGFFKNLSMW